MKINTTFMLIKGTNIAVDIKLFILFSFNMLLMSMYSLDIRLSTFCTFYYSQPPVLTAKIKIHTLNLRAILKPRFWGPWDQPSIRH